ncbi:hypothetical protein I4U23_031512 [Adineta vaga]|nr:hypothetical protein I4U23_031512 [Adineta vaga]
MIDGKNQTDETECELWECDNIYTHCDKIWNCLDGKDEMNCNSSLFNCSLDSRMCVTFDTYELICLSINRFNNGIIDCIGGTDELTLCRPPYSYIHGGFYCPNAIRIPCLDPIDSCTNIAWCFNKEDEKFCQKNRSIEIDSSICEDKYISFGSNTEKFLCDITKEYDKERMKIFYN